MARRKNLIKKACVKINFNDTDLEFYRNKDKSMRQMFGLTLPAVWHENDKEDLINSLEDFLKELEMYNEYAVKFEHLLEELKE